MSRSILHRHNLTSLFQCLRELANNCGGACSSVKAAAGCPQCRAIFAVTTMIGPDQALHSCHHQVSSASQIHRGIFLRLQRCRIPKLPRRRHHDTTSSAPSVVWWIMATIETTIVRRRRRWHQRAHAMAVCPETLMLHEIRHFGFDFR